MKVCISELTSALKSSSPFIYETETQLALGGSAKDNTVAEAIVSLKGRKSTQVLPMIATAECAAKAFDLKLVNTELLEKVLAVWPGPLTVVAPVRSGLNDELSREVISVKGTIAIRVSSSPVAQEVAEASGGFVISTSANLTGQPAVSLANISTSVFGNLPLFVADPRKSFNGEPSTIVDITRGQEKVLREGAFDAKALLPRT